MAGDRSMEKGRSQTRSRDRAEIYKTLGGKQGPTLIGASKWSFCASAPWSRSDAESKGVYINPLLCEPAPKDDDHARYTPRRNSLRIAGAPCTKP
jgi:hypothetical protein